ncbi:MAG: hypothetical protein V1809_12010 [Planctomycetota bacterium]
MKALKSFDCVKMKNDVQARLLKAREGKSDQEVRDILERKLQSSNSPVGRVWKKLQSGTVSSRGR